MQTPKTSLRFIALIAVSIFSSLASTFAPSFAFASDPSTHWSTIETPHFELVFDSRQQSLAQVYAKDAEAAFAVVSPAFGVWPEQTIIFLDDSTDVSNGSATPWPYPLIMAYPVLPTTNDVVGEYGDWGLELLTHEYTHILNFAPANGIFKPFRFIFGSIVSPNVLLPRWYSEGLAVEMETRYSSFGRLRAGGFLSIARAMAEEGKLRNEDIARINEALPDFPGGNRAYLMGALIWDEVTRKAGDGIIGDLNTAYSRRIPFLIDGPLKDRLGIGWQDVLNDVYSRVEKRTMDQVALIHSVGQVDEHLIAREGYYTHSPSISPNGLRLAYIGKAHNTDNLLMVMTRESSQAFSSSLKSIHINESTSINRVSWLPDSSGFVFDAIDTVNRYYEYSDLYRCDYKNEKPRCKVKKLTTAARAREPSVSPSGRAIVFVQTTPGTTSLAAIRADGKDLVTLFNPAFQERISSPTFLSDHELIFSLRNLDGRETLRYVKFQEADDGAIKLEGVPTEVLSLYAPARQPQMTAKGLTFLSDKTGITNLYLADRALKSARAITNTTTRILDGEIDGVTGDIVYSRLEASGAGLFSIAAADVAKLPSAPPNVPPLIDTSYPNVNRPALPSTDYETGDYHPSRYMMPKYLFPYGYFLPGGLYGQISTSGMDPALRHSYALTGAYDTLSNKPSVFGAYTNATTSIPITLAGQDINEYLYSSNLVRETVAGALTGAFYLPGLSNHWKGSLGWQYLNTEAQGTATSRQGAQLGFKYTNIQQRGYEISPEKGGSAKVAHSHFFDGLGNTSYDETEFSFSKFFSGFVLPDRHALAFFINGSIAPALNRSILGRTTVGGNYQNGLIQDSFLMRGYQSGVFLGRNLISGTAEYRFPLLYNYRGLGTYPLFFRRLHAALFLDAITLDGLSFPTTSGGASLGVFSEKLGTFHLGTGVEIKFDTTIFYYLPVQFIVGAYYGTDTKLNPNGVFPFLGIGL